MTTPLSEERLAELEAFGREHSWEVEELVAEIRRYRNTVDWSSWSERDELETERDTLRSQLAKADALLGTAREALGYYSGLRIEVIRACSGGVCEVPHRVMLNEQAVAALAKLDQTERSEGAPADGK